MIEAPADGGVLAVATRWTKILGAYATAQGLAQLLSQLAGLLFVNYLPVGEFALYTIAASFIGFFTFATDLGATSSLIYFFHQAKKGDGSFEAAHAAVLALRHRAFLAGAVVVAIALPVTAHASGFALVPAALCAAAVVASSGFHIVSGMRLLSLRLEGQYGAAYRAEIAGNAVRFVLAVLIVVSLLRHAWLAVTSGALALAVMAWLMRPAASSPSASPAPTREEQNAARRRVLHYLLPTLPSALYFSIQGPLTVWLATVFGETRNIAEVGALSRLGALLVLVSNLNNIVFLPRLASVTDDRLYRRRYLQFGGFLALVVSLIIGFVALAPELFLWLLGGSYRGLRHELLLVALSSCLSVLSGYAVGVNMARSWNRWQSLNVAALITAQVILVLALDLHTTAGVLWFNLGTGMIGLSLQLLTTACGFVRPAWVTWK